MFLKIHGIINKVGTHSPKQTISHSKFNSQQPEASHYPCKTIDKKCDIPMQPRGPRRGRGPGRGYGLAG